MESTLRDDIRFATDRIMIGSFECPIGYPGFRDTGPIERHIVVFPRTSVWIRHEGSERFLCDTSTANIYNRGQRYERFAASSEGDRCDWFAVSDDLAREIAATFDESARDADQPFRHQWTPTPMGLYVEQRAVFNQALKGTLDRLHGEEAVLSIVGAVLREANAIPPRFLLTRRWAERRRRDLVASVRVELMRCLDQNRSISELAATVGSSPYHLCRVFREITGMSIHQFRTELRIRRAFELLGPNASSYDISSVALRLGFSSHSHLVQAMRRHTGMTPSRVRELLA